jgi:hypothetical protein
MSEALAAIKRLYYEATRASISRDFDRAIDLLKSLPTEEEREHATVYMHGLAEMRAQWQRSAKFGVPSAELVRSAKSVRGAKSVRSAEAVRSANPKGKRESRGPERPERHANQKRR